MAPDLLLHHRQQPAIQHDCRKRSRHRTECGDAVPFLILFDHVRYNTIGYQTDFTVHDDRHIATDRISRLGFGTLVGRGSADLLKRRKGRLVIIQRFLLR